MCPNPNINRPLGRRPAPGCAPNPLVRAVNQFCETVLWSQPITNPLVRSLVPAQFAGTVMQSVSQTGAPFPPGVRGVDRSGAAGASPFDVREHVFLIILFFEDIDPAAFSILCSTTLQSGCNPEYCKVHDTEGDVSN